MKFKIVLLFTVLFLTFSCTSSIDGNIDLKTEKVTISSSEVFEYRTGLSGDEEEATITQQPDHYEISKVIRDSTTNWESVYRYKPESGFEGTDQVKIKLEAGSDGASPNTDITLITIEITVN